jgi:hypothetical protein
MPITTDPTFDSVRDKKVNAKESIGTPGQVIYGGYLDNGESTSKLRGVTKYKTFSEILANTSIVAAGVRYFLNLLSKSAWHVEPANESPEAVKLAQAVEFILDDMKTPWHRIVRRAAMYRFYGFSIQEWTAKRNEQGHIAFLDIKARPQVTISRWDVDSAGNVLGVEQQNPNDYSTIYLPRSKIIYLTDDSLNDSPEGLGLFRHLVKPAHALTRFEELEAFGYETDLRGIPIARAPLAELDRMQENEEITAAQRTAIESPMRTFLNNHIKNPKLALLMDSMTYQSQDESGQPSNVPMWDIDLLKSSSTSQPEILAAINRLNRECAIILGVEGLLLGSDSKGSYALSTDKSDSFSLIVDSTLMEIKETFEDDFLDTLWNLNGWDKKLKPELKTDKIQFRDIQSITSSLRDMAQAGAILSPDDPAISEVRGLLGLSEPLIVNTDLDASLLGESGNSNVVNDNLDLREIDNA